MLWWLVCIYLAVALWVFVTNYEAGDSLRRVVRDVTEAVGWLVVYVPWREWNYSGQHRKTIVLSQNLSLT